MDGSEAHGTRLTGCVNLAFRELDFVKFLACLRGSTISVLETRQQIEVYESSME